MKTRHIARSVLILLLVGMLAYIAGCNGNGDEDEDDNEIEGVVTSVTSADTFVVNDTQTVQITNNTRFEGGTAVDITEGVFVEVEGFVNNAAVLIAEEVAFGGDGDDNDDNDDNFDFNPPADHTDLQDGFRHRPGKDEPFRNGCTQCHGSELTGAASGGSAPSCFTCHGEVW